MLIGKIFLYALARLVIIVDKSITLLLISKLRNLTSRTSKKRSLKYIYNIYMSVCTCQNFLAGNLEIYNIL